jgi:plasmid stabilization system protein ParE
MKVRILDEAISDLRLGAQFYEDQSVGLGTYFLDTLFSDIESLHLYAGVHIQIEEYFRLLSKRFPYAVYYKIDGETVLIYAVLDCRRNPSTNLKLLTNRRT